MTSSLNNMANVKISQLPASTSISSGDLLVMVADPGGSPVTDKITFGDVLASAGSFGFTLADNVSLVWGTTAPFSITAQVAGLVKPYGVITVANNTANVVTWESQKTFDYLGFDPGPVPHPIYLWTDGSPVRNAFAIMGFSFDTDRQFDIMGTGGDDLNETTTHNASGISVRLAAGEGGTDGGDGGNIVVKTGSGRASGAKAGDFVLDFGSGSYPARDGRIALANSSPGTSFVFQPLNGGGITILNNDTGTSYYQIISSENVSTISSHSPTTQYINDVNGSSSTPFDFAPNLLAPDQIPDAFVSWHLPGYVGAGTDKDVVDFKLDGSECHFLGGQPDSSSNFFAFDVTGRTYTNSGATNTISQIATMHLQAPSYSGFNLVNGAWSLITDGGINNLGQLITGHIGINTLPDTNVAIISDATSGYASLWAPGGLVLQSNSGGGLTTMGLDVVGSVWSDAVDASGVDLHGASNNNALFYRNATGTVSPFDRMMFNSTFSQFFNGPVVNAHPPTSILEAQADTDALIFKVRAASGQTSDLVNLNAANDMNLWTVQKDGVTGILCVPRSGFGVGTNSGLAVGGDITTKGNSTNILFNVYRDPGGGTVVSADTGYGAAIGSNGGGGALDFYVSNNAMSGGVVVTPAQVLSLKQDLSAQFFGEIDLTSIGNTSDNIKFNATANTPATTWTAGVPSNNPAGYLQVNVGGVTRFMPYWI